MTPASPRPLSRESTDEKLKQARLLDDIYMSVFFSQEKACVKEVLDIILGKDLQIESATTQQVWTNPGQRSVRLDVFAKDSSGKLYNIEVQREKEEAHPYRARYHGSSIDTHNVSQGTNWKDLPEVYIIFVTESDVLGFGLPMYTVSTILEETQTPIDLGLHIQYINTSARYVGSELSSRQLALNALIDDFLCQDPKDMHSAVLAARAHYLKNTEKGRILMYGQFNDIYEEGREVERQDALLKMASILKDLGMAMQEAIAKLCEKFTNVTEEFITTLITKHWSTL